MSASPATSTRRARVALATGFGRLEATLERWGERLNPILIKEARQALKSRHFTVTFALLLSCAWVWSVLGIVWQLPDIYYAPSGLTMLLGYYVILAVPMLLIVPFSAFRSLASEREDLTYELLSISTLTSRQIITGKLGSAILQMMVYYSALAPCIAFTYLLRGVDIISLLLLLAYTFCISLMLCCLGLVFAGLARSRHWQSLISVLLLLALIVAGFIWGSMVFGIALSGLAQLPLDDADFWIAQAAVFTAFLTYIALLILAAAAQNSFPSDNRSTRLRVAMCVQTLLFVGWTGYGWIYTGEYGLLFVSMIFAVIHWYVYGVLMTGESAKLSPRVRRQLPMSFFGRVFLTWFNPGSGTGYVFAVSHVLVLTALVTVAAIVQRDLGVPNLSYPNITILDRGTFMCILLAGYFVAYLGFSRLIVLLVPRRERFGLLLPALINVLIPLAGCALPFVYEAWRRNYSVKYSLAQVTNWMWTLEETLDNGPTDARVMVLVPLAAAAMLVVNLMLVRGEIEAVRMATPERVMLDEAAGKRQDTAADGSPVEPLDVLGESTS
jgi:hypothetical protein